MVSPTRASLDGGISRAVSAGSRSPFTTSSVRPSARLRAARSQLVLSPLGGSGSAVPPVVAPSSLEQGSTYISPTYTFTSGRQADGSYERWFDLQAYETYKRTGIKVPPRRPPNPPLLPRPAHSDEEKEEHAARQGEMIEISDEQLTAAMNQQLQDEQQLQAMVDHIRATEETDEDPLHQMRYAPRTSPEGADGKPPARRRPQAEEDEDSPHDSERDEEIDNWDDDDDDPEVRDTIKEEGEDKFDEATYDDLTLSALRSAATDRSVKDLDAVRTRARMERRRARRKKEEEARAAALGGGGLGGSGLLGGLGGPGSSPFLSIPGAPLIAMSGLPVAGTSSSAGLGGGGGGGYTSRQMSRRVSTVGVTFHPATFDTYDEDVKQGMESVAEIYPHNQAQHSSVSHVQRLTAVEQQKREEKERLKALQVKRRARRRQAAEDQVREIFGDAWWMVQADRLPDQIALSSKSAKALAHMRRLQAKAKRAFTSATLTIHHNHATNYRVHPAIKPLNFFRILPDRPQPVIEVSSTKSTSGFAAGGGSGSTLPNGAMTSTGSGGTTYKNDGSLSALGAGPPSPLPKQGGSQMFRTAARQVTQALAFAGPSGALTATGSETAVPSTARGGAPGGGDKTTRPLLQHQLSSPTLMPPQTGRTPGRSMLGVAADHEQSASGSLLRPPQGSPGRSFSPSPTLSDRRGSSSNPSLSDRANAAAVAASERAMTLQPQTGKFVPHPQTGRIIPMPLPPTKPHTMDPGGTTVDLNKNSDEESDESEELSDEDGPLQSDTPPLLPLPSPSLLPPAAAALLAPGSKPDPPPPAPVPLSSPSWPLGPPQARREEELETLVAAATRSYALTTWLHKHGKHGLGGGGAAGVALDPALAHRYHDAFKTLDQSASGEITAETIAAALRRTHNLHLPAEELEVLLCKLKLAGDYSLAGTNAAAAAKARRAKAFAGVSDAMLAASHLGNKHKEQIQQQAFVSALATTSEWEALLDVWRARKAQAAAAAAAAATSTTTATGTTPSSSTSPERRSPSPTHTRTASLAAPSHTRRSSMASTGSQTGSTGLYQRTTSPATLLPFLLWIPAFQRLQLIEAAMELSRGTGGAPGVLSESQLHPPAHAPAHERERASVLRAREAAIQARFERLLRKMHMPSGSTLTELWQATRSQVRKELEDQAAGRYHPNDSNDVSVSESDDSDDSWFDDAAEGGGGAEGSDSARILASSTASYEGMLEGTAVAATKVVNLSENMDANTSAGLSSPTSPLGRTLSSGSLMSLAGGSGPGGRGSLVTSGSRRNLNRTQTIQSGASSQSNTHRGGGGDTTGRLHRALHGAGFMGGPMLPSSTPFGPTTINTLAPPVTLVGPMSKLKQRGLDADSVAIAQAEKRMAAEHARIAAEEHAAQMQAQREREALEQDAADRAALALEEEDEADPTIDGVDLSADPVDEAELDELASIKILRSPLMAGQSRRALEWTSTVLPRRLDPLVRSRPNTAGGNTPRTPEVPSPLQRPKRLLGSSPAASPKSPAPTSSSSSLETPVVFQVHVHSPKSSSAAAATASAVNASTTPSNKLYRRGSGGDLDALHATLAATAAAAAAATAAESPFEVLLQFTWVGAGAPVSVPASNPEAGWKRLPLPAVRTAPRDLIVCSFSFRSLARAGAGTRRGEGAGTEADNQSVNARNALVSRSPGRNAGVLAPLSRLPSSSRSMQTPPLRAYAGLGGSRRTLSALQETDGDDRGFLDASPVDVPPRSSNSSPQRRALKTGEHLLSFVVNPLVQLYKNDRSLIDVTQLDMQQSSGHAAMLEAADEVVYVTPQFQLEE